MSLARVFFPQLFWSKLLLPTRFTNCPQCTDFLLNADKFINSQAGEISVLADKFARAQTSNNYIDDYIFHYRTEYTRLYNLRKPAWLNKFNDILTLKYIGSQNLCKKCKFTDDSTAKFCFHESHFDQNCENCALKLGQ